MEQLLWRLQGLLSRDGQRVPVLVLSMFWLDFGTRDGNEKESILTCMRASEWAQHIHLCSPATPKPSLPLL